MERKTISLSELKFADGGTDTAMKFTGYGAVFGNVDFGGDKIDAGAFTKTLADAKKSGQFPAMLLQHGGWGVSAEDKMPIGVWESLKEDDHGLLSEGVLADTTRGRDAYTLMKMQPRPAITGLSIGYIPRKFTMGTKGGEPRRTLHEVELMEISLVTFPMNGKARVTNVKSAEDLTEREFEALLREVGYSKRESGVIIAHGFKSLQSMRDAGSGEIDQVAEAIRRNINTLTGA